MKKVSVSLWWLAAGLLMFFISACSLGFDAKSEIGETTIRRLKEEKLENIPFEEAEVLKSFTADPQILDYILL